MSQKEALLEHCWDYLKEKEKTLMFRYQSLQDSLKNETKSTAGDKHETGRAMLQLEREKLGQQIHEVEKMKVALSKVDIKKSRDKISLGSLFSTDQYQYFIAISGGTFKTDEITIFCISAQTPIAIQTIGKGIGDSFTINGKTQKIVSVL